MSIHTRAAALALVLVPVALAAQPSPRVTPYRSNDGTPIEIVGLRRWTVQMLEDSIARHAPGESLASHACQAVLQYQLGFPSASVVHHVTPHDGRSTIVITLVEPQDSTRLGYRRVTAAARPRVARWADLYTPVEFVNDSTKPAEVMPGPLMAALQARRIGRLRGDSAGRAYLADLPAPMRDSVAAFVERLARHAAPRDLALAAATLGGDGRRENRMLAAAVLANFARDDAAWRRAAEAMLDRDEGVREAATGALQIMAAERGAPVDWRPLLPQLRAKIGGAGVGGLDEMLQVAMSTRIAPEVAREALAGNAALVLGKASLSDGFARQTARQFLALATGRQATVDEWEGMLGQ